jgi:hypothetical protein
MVPISYSEHAVAHRRHLLLRNPSSEMTFFEGGSFRDRSARVLIRRDGVFRWLDDEGLKAWNRVSATPFFPRLMAEGQIVSTRELSRDETAQLGMATAAAALQHETIPFISYPYEWSFGMLRQAALLHLRILSEAIDGGLMLKDASPYNVQFRGTRPVFILANPGRPIASSVK